MLLEDPDAEYYSRCISEERITRERDPSRNDEALGVDSTEKTRVMEKRAYFVLDMLIAC